MLDRAEVVRGGLSRRRTGRSAPDAAHATALWCAVWCMDRGTLLLPHCLSFFCVVLLVVEVVVVERKATSTD